MVQVVYIFVENSFRLLFIAASHFVLLRHMMQSVRASTVSYTLVPLATSYSSTPASTGTTAGSPEEMARLTKTTSRPPGQNWTVLRQKKKQMEIFFNLQDSLVLSIYHQHQARNLLLLALGMRCHCKHRVRFLFFATLFNYLQKLDKTTPWSRQEISYDPSSNQLYLQFSWWWLVLWKCPLHSESTKIDPFIFRPTSIFLGVFYNHDGKISNWIH